MFFDPLYLIVLAPALLLTVWAQFRVKSAFHAGAQVPVRSGLSGAEAARMILDNSGLRDVGIELAQGALSDHYDPRRRVLRLSPEVAHGRSVSSVGVAAHEAGHALQQARGYAPLALRNGIVPLASLGSGLSWILLLAGLILNVAGLAWAGVALFGAVVVFQLVNLPVEFDASNRAKVALEQMNIVSPNEAAVVRRVLSAAAMTYVAATLTAVLTLVYFVLRANSTRN